MIGNMDEICANAVKKWGVYSQLMVVIEELSELQKAVCNFYRGREHNIPEEIADVRIMLRQLELICNCEDQADRQINNKLCRLRERLDLPEKKGGVYD